MHLFDGTTPSPIPTDSKWYVQDQMLLSWINATLSESTLPYIAGISSSKKAWDLLQQWYASTTPSHIMSLKRQISRIKKGSQSMTEYLQQFKNIVNQLAAFGFAISALADEKPQDLRTAFVAPRAGRPTLTVVRLEAEVTLEVKPIMVVVVLNSHIILSTTLIMVFFQYLVPPLQLDHLIRNVRSTTKWAIWPLIAFIVWTMLTKADIPLRN
ncbi:hypothetical protein NE237_015606 [Protea cynaroides]|uniref:Retrotransposon gag domain-containing protein n=1 Tax=Protea cynaroides TaxID=273540 RepID=A0A9Q0QR36_9MAGN|nr:hypothetical protein NE237_015606 [Protea cynaroides]